jgi:hypothetical protein
MKPGTGNIGTFKKIGSGNASSRLSNLVTQIVGATGNPSRTTPRRWSSVKVSRDPTCAPECPSKIDRGPEKREYLL